MSAKKQRKTRSVKIRLLTGEMGAGKTEKCIQEIAKSVKDDPNALILYIALSHKSLYEMERRLGMCNISYVHWEGFLRLCPKLHEQQIIRDLFAIQSKSLRIKQICDYCLKERFIKKSKCPYQQQYRKKASVVLAPLAFLDTWIVKRRIWDYIFVDDINIMDKKLLPPLEDLEDEWAKLFAVFFLHKIPDGSTESIPFYEFNDIEFKKFSYEIKERSRKLYSILVESGQFIDWAKDENKRFILNPNVFSMYYFRRIMQVYTHQEPIQKASYMIIFHLFRLAGKKTQITIIGKHTPPRRKLLEALADKYYKETGVTINFFIEELSHWRGMPKRAPLIQICPEGRYPKQSLRSKRTLERIDRDLTHAINRIKNGFYQGKKIRTIGIITSKEFSNLRELNAKFPLSIRPFFYKVIVTFGDLKGTNIFLDKDVDVVVVLGTYIIDHRNLKAEHDIVFLDNDLQSSTAWRSSDRGFYYDPGKLESMRQYYEEDEMTQAIGRSVPRGIPAIIVGNVPEYLQKEYEDVYQLIRFKLVYTGNQQIVVSEQEFIDKVEMFLLDFFDKRYLYEMRVNSVHQLLLKEDFNVPLTIKRFHTKIRHLMKDSEYFEVVTKSTGQRGRSPLFLQRK